MFIISITERKNISLLNYCNNIIVVGTKDASYAIPASDGNIPSVITLSFDDIKYLNSASDVFKTGLLRFDPKDEEEIYNELNITDWRNILTTDMIKDCILNPEYNKLKRLVDIKSLALIERVRGILIKLKNDGEENIYSRVERLINTRYKELLNGQVKSSINLTPKEGEQISPPINDEVAAVRQENQNLKQQNEDILKQLEEMKQLLQKVSNDKDNKDNNNMNNKTDNQKNPKASVVRAKRKTTAKK